MGPGCHRLRIANIAGQEVLDQASDNRAVFLQGKVPRIEQVLLGVR